MMLRGRAHPAREPSSHMRPPVNLLKSYVIQRKARENSSDPSGVCDPLEYQERDRIREKERDNSPGIPRKIDVPGRLGGLQSVVMHHVLLGKNSVTRVQQESVQAIFKAIGIKKPCNYA